MWGEHARTLTPRVTRRDNAPLCTESFSYTCWPSDASRHTRYSRDFNVSGRWTPDSNSTDHTSGLPWWQKNHPDMVLYRCDRTTPAWECRARGNSLHSTPKTVQISPHRQKTQKERRRDRETEDNNATTQRLAPRRNRHVTSRLRHAKQTVNSWCAPHRRIRTTTRRYDPRGLWPRAPPRDERWRAR